MSAIMSISLVFISIRVGEYSIAILGIALMGSCFGFLPFNFNPAKIFMGDTRLDILGIYACNIVYTRCVQELCGNIVCSTAFDFGIAVV